MTSLHLVSHTHWDREWYRTFQQFRLRLVHLVDGVLDLLEKDRTFKYFMLDGQTIVLEDYLLMRPENEERIRKHVRSGRLAIGPWHILPDEFLVSPEATIRNLLEGKRTCNRFGPRMNVGYVPDPFGHIGQLPQILQGFDIQTACVQRGLSDERCEFWWEAPDGSRVFMAYLRDGYGNAAGLPTASAEHFTAEVRRLRDSLLAHSNTDRSVLLMHGTDHMEPPTDTAKAIAATRSLLDGDELIHSTLGDYVESVMAALRREHIPTMRGELRDCKRSHLLPGVLSTRMWIKQRNHLCETKLERWAEPFSTLASEVVSEPLPANLLAQPATILRQAWRLLMECHPHDSICGCSIDQVHDEMKVRFDQVEQISDEITGQSLVSLAGSVATTAAEAQAAVVVFNPHSFAHSEAVEANVESASAFDLLDEEGRTVPFQERGLGSKELVHARMTPKELQSLYVNIHDGRVMGMSIQAIKVERQGDTVHLEATVSETRPPEVHAWEKGVAEIEALIADPGVKVFRVRAVSVDTRRITFAATEVPGLGWKTYHIRTRLAEQTAPVSIPPLARLLLPLAKLPWAQRLAIRHRKDRAPYWIENDLLKVEALTDGSLSITDKKTGASMVGSNRFLDGGDCGDEYNYCPPPQDRMTTARLKKATLERGAVQQSLTLTLELPTPASLSTDRKTRDRKTLRTEITSRVTLTHGVPRVDVHTTVRNQAKDHRLRVHFPAPFHSQAGEYGGHFEVVERKIGVPAHDQTWVEEPRPEVPQRAFTSVTDGKGRLTIASRGLPEVETLVNSSGNAEIAVTLLRCVGWLSRDDFSNRKGHAGPYLETPGAQMIGSWDFDYAIIPATMESLPAYQQAYAFEAPLKAATTGIHAGALPAQGSFVAVNPGAFLLSALKKAENDKGWLVRGVNLSDHEIQVELRPWRSFWKVLRTNLAEEKTATLHPAKEDGAVSFVAKGHEIVTILLND